MIENSKRTDAFRIGVMGTDVAFSAKLVRQASPTETSAATIEVPRKCNALVAKNFPPRQPGNPAAGSAKGNGQAERDYFKKCVDNGGNVDDTADKDKK